MCQEMLATVLRNKVDIILSRAPKAPVINDPFIFFVHKITKNICERNSNEIVRETIKEIADEYVQEQRLYNLFYQTIFKNVINEFVSETFREFLVEEVGRELIEMQIRRLTEPILLSIIESFPKGKFRKKFLQRFARHVEKEITEDIEIERGKLPNQWELEMMADRVLNGTKEFQDIDGANLMDFKLND